MSTSGTTGRGGLGGGPETDFTAATAGARQVPQFRFPLSRRTDPVSVVPGARVIVRYTLDGVDAANSGKKVTDAIGELLSIDPLRVRRAGVRGEHVGQQGRQQGGGHGEEHGEVVEIAPERVVVLKTLSAKPVRTSDIRNIEQAIAHAFPGIDNQMIGGWLARAGDGITERSNSAVPISPEAGLQPVPLEQIEEFYARHELPTQLLLPDRIGRVAESIPGQRGPEIIVMTRDLSEDMELPAASCSLAETADVQFSIDNQPDDQWLGMYHFRGRPLPRHALVLLCARIDGQLGFGRLTVDGKLAAITRGTVTEGGHRRLLGYSAVEVAEPFRRQGLGTLMGLSMLRWGAEQGADGAYLEVIETNTAGRALYQRLGFSEHHRHRTLRTGESSR